MASGSEVEPRIYSNFTQREVKDSVTKFSGEDSHDVECWIHESEDCAHVLKWSKLQNFIYSKQLLIGAAKTVIRSQFGARDWGALKTILYREFGVQPSAVSILK